MSLARFNIIVAIDSAGGIAKNGHIPWNSKADMMFFRDKTKGNGKNAVIMGRETYLGIPEEFRPLEGRHNVIITKTMNPMEHSNCSLYPSLIEALAALGSYNGKYEDVYICGGERLYEEAVSRFLYLCKRIYVTKFKIDYGCDRFFPIEKIIKLSEKKKLVNKIITTDVKIEGEPFNTRDFLRTTYQCNFVHPEVSYLNLVEFIKDEGVLRPDRTGTGTKSVFGEKLEFDISETIPLITTKQVSFDNILKELLWFVSGNTNSKKLSATGCHIWDKNSTRRVIEELKLEYDEGDCGPIYGFQWRHWGAEYKGCNRDYKDQGIDQLSDLIRQIKLDPFNRRHILTAWNVEDLKKMVLNPCHVLCQFYVDSTRTWLDCQLYQRSCDMMLGVPYNIVSYSILTYMIAHLCSLKPRKLIHVMGDAHIYNTHIDGAVKQLARTPRPFPSLVLKNTSQVFEIDDFKLEHFELKDYTCWPHIKFDMAV